MKEVKVLSTFRFLSFVSMGSLQSVLYTPIPDTVLKSIQLTQHHPSLSSSTGCLQSEYH